MATVAQNINDYIAGFPAEVQARLEQIRNLIKKAVPESEEAIKYAIPTFIYHGNMVSFAAYKNHIGIYPVPAGDEKFQGEIAPYKALKSTAQFLHNQPLPLELIEQLVLLRSNEMIEALKKKKK